MRKGSGLRPCTQSYCFAAVLRVTSSPCFAGRYWSRDQARPQRASGKREPASSGTRRPRLETEAAEPAVSGVHLGRDVNAAPGTLNVLAMSRTGFPSASNCAATCALHQGRGHRSSPEAAGASLPGRHSNSPISACLASPVCPASPASPARLACLAVSDPCFPPFRLPKKPKFLNPYGRGHAPPLKTRTHARNGARPSPSHARPP